MHAGSPVEDALLAASFEQRNALAIMARGERPNRSDYRDLPSEQIHRVLARANFWLDIVDTEDDEFEVRFMVQELRAVLQERG